MPSEDRRPRPRSGRLTVGVRTLRSREREPGYTDRESAASGLAALVFSLRPCVRCLARLSRPPPRVPREFHDPNFSARTWPGHLPDAPRLKEDIQQKTPFPLVSPNRDDLYDCR